MVPRWRFVFGCQKLFREVPRRFSTKTKEVGGVNLRPEPYNVASESIFTEQHVELRQSLNKLIEREINPFVEEWEKAHSFPAHEVFKKLGDAGFLGVNKPIEYGGMGLDYSYSVAMAEELGECINIKFQLAFSP